MMVRRVVIKASDVAACTGLNPYKAASEVRDELWKKYFGATFQGQTKEDLAREALSKSVGAQKILSEVLNTKAKDSTEAQATFEKARAKIEADETVSPEDRKKIIEHVRSRCYTAHGTRSEDRTAEKVETDEKTTLVKDNAFYTLVVKNIDETEYVITGKIDRLEISPDGAKTLVEIKNRTRGLFREVRDYENVQIQVYLRMLGLVRAKLVEQYNEKTNTLLVTRDEDLWTNVIWPRLVTFCEDLHSAASGAK